MPQSSIPLAAAAHRLRRSYQKARDLVLTGALDGEQRDGRWFVTTESVDRLAAANTEQRVA